MPAHKHKNTRLPFADRSPVVPLLAAIGLLAWLGFLYKNNIAGVFDIGIYEGIGGRLKEILQGGTGNIDSEYPPLATLLFFFAEANPLRVGFDIAWLVIVLGSIGAAGAYAVFVLRDRLGWLIPASIAGTVFLIGPELVFARFDVLVAVMLLLSLRARATGHFAHCAAFLAVACAIKIVPALLIPAVFATAPRSEWKRMGLGFLAGLGVSFLIPVVAMGVQLTVQNITHMLEYHANREVQLESTWSSVQMLMKAWVGQRAPVSLGHLSVNNNDLGPVITSIAKYLIAGVSVGAGVFAFFKRRQGQEDTLPTGVLLFAVAASPVFSPQYIVWLLPLLLTWLALRMHTICERRTFWTVAALTAAAGFGTQWVFPLNYMDVIDQKSMALFMLNVRNIAVLLLGITLLRHALFPAKATIRRRIEFTGGLCRLAVDCGMLLLAVILLQSFRQAFLPIVSDARYDLSNGVHGSAPAMPFELKKVPDGNVTMTMLLQLPPTVTDKTFLLKPDDCIESFTINGQNVPEAAFCGDAHVVDFAAYLKSDRRNVVVANIKNNGGPVGLIIGPGKLDLLPFSMTASVLITLGMVLASTWNLVSICIGLRRKHAHPAAIRADVRGKTCQLLQLPLLETLALA